MQGIFLVLLSGALLELAVAQTQDVWLLQTDRVPLDDGQFKLMPMLGNGHIGVNTFLPSMRRQCLYNGDIAGESHRTRIEGKTNIRMKIDGDTLYTLDMKQGLFRQDVEHENYSASHTVLVHRKIGNLVLNSVTVSPSPSNSILEIPLRYTQIQDDTNKDIEYDSEPKSWTLGSNELGIEVVDYACGTAKNTEASPNGPVVNVETICVAYSRLENIVFTGQDATFTKNYITVLADTEEELKHSLDEIASMSLETLLNSHVVAWDEIWKSGTILLDGDIRLTQTVLASQYYLYSNLPFNTSLPSGFCGLSPGGLSYGGLLMDYQGHSFWDTEIWMYPSIAVLQPQQAQNLLNYRLERLESAREHAEGGGWQGARYPWESGLVGFEVCPDFAAETRENQIHISGDISFAARQYLALSGDLAWFTQQRNNVSGCDLIYDIAKYWSSRISITSDQLTEIHHVMGPDEDHGDVSNNVYTNYIASTSVHFADFIGCATSCPNIPQDWLALVKNLRFEYDAGLDYHPQYSGYSIGTGIKQADTVLLGFPLMYPMNTSTRMKDLQVYGEVVRSDGPAMTWGMHAIGHIETRNFEEAEHFFNKSYQPYVREPFNMWTEQQPPNVGAVNFITGMGGFLQGLIFGYGGMRTHVDRLELNPTLPPYTRSMEIKGIDYQGSVFDLILDDDFLFLHFQQVEGSVTIRQGEEETSFSNPVDIDLERGIFTIQRDNVEYIDKCFQ